MQPLRISKIPRLKTRLWHIVKRETMQWQKLHDIDKNLTSTHLSHRYIFYAWESRQHILERAKLCTCWRFPKSWGWKRDYGTSLNARWCNGRKLHDIDNNRASTQFSRRYIFQAWDTCEDILDRAKLCTCWGFPTSQDQKLDYGKSLNARRCNEKKNYMISTPISHPRTFHVDIISSRETPAMTF